MAVRDYSLVVLWADEMVASWADQMGEMDSTSVDLWDGMVNY